MLTSTALDLGAGLQVLCSRHRSSYVDQDSMGDWFFAVKFFLYVARLDAGRAAQAAGSTARTQHGRGHTDQRSARAAGGSAHPRRVQPEDTRVGRERASVPPSGS